MKEIEKLNETTNQVVKKEHELTINISPANRANIITNTTFFSMDVETGKKIINFTHDNDPVDLTDATVMLGFEFVAAETSKIIDSTDGSVMIEDAQMGQCSVILPNHMYNYAGQVLVHVYIMYEDGYSLDCGVIVTQFEESWLDSELEEMSEFYIKRFEDLATNIKSRLAELEEKLENVSFLEGLPASIHDHVNNQEVHLNEGERKVLFGETTSHQLTRSGTLVNTVEGKMANRHLEGRTFVNLWSDDQEDFERIDGSITLNGCRVSMTSTTSQRELVAQLNTQIFKRNTTYSMLVDLIKNEKETFITLPDDTEIRTLGRHLVTFRIGSTLETSLSFLWVNPTLEVGSEIEFDLSIYEGDWSHMRGELPHTPPRKLSSAGDGGQLEITTARENQTTSTTIEYQDIDGVWKTPVLQSIYRGTELLVADEITETEYIQRVSEVDYRSVNVRDFTHGSEASTTTRFRLDTANQGLLVNSSEEFGSFSVLSNGLPQGNAINFTETALPGAHMVSGRLSVRLPKDRTLTATNIRQHLMDNGYQFLVPLAEPRRFPIRMGLLSSFSPTTHVTINSGAVQPQFSFDVIQSLPGRMALAEQKIRDLQLADAEGLLGPQGPQGERGLPGAQGERGLTGPEGQTGPQGERGLPGVAGPSGPVGATGPQGERGATGPQGPTGERGMTGATGPQGLTGSAGTPGTTSWNGITDRPSTFTPSTHNHAGENITSGTVPFARMPVGSTATTVSQGNHSHSLFDLTGVDTSAFGSFSGSSQGRVRIGHLILAWGRTPAFTGSHTIVFPGGFAGGSQPQVMLTPFTASANITGLRVTGANSNQVTIAFGGATTAHAINWLAIGPIGRMD